MANHFKQLGKDSLIYGIGGAFSSIMGGLLIPFYTRYFTPAEFGAIETLDIFLILFTVITTIGLDSAQTNFFLKKRSEGHAEQAKLFSTIFTISSVLWVVFGILFIVVFDFINQQFFNNIIQKEVYIIAICFVFVLNTLNQSILIFRLELRPIPFLLITILRTLSTYLIIIVLTTQNWSIYGYYIGLLTGGIVALVPGIYSVRKYFTLSFVDVSLLKRLLKFSLPMASSGLMVYALNTSDRWFILKYAGEIELGIYSVAAKFIFILYLVITPFRAAWRPIAIKVLYNEKNPGYFFIRMASIFISLGTVLCLSLTFISPMLLQVFTTPLYFSGYAIIGILSWSAIFYGWYVIIDIGIWKTEKTIFGFLSLFIAVIVNIFLDFLLVPRFHAEGAAIATSFSFFVWNMLVLYFSEKSWKLNHFYIFYLSQIAIGVSACMGMLFMYRNNFNLLWITILFISSSFFILVQNKRNLNFQQIKLFVKSITAK